MTFLFYIMEFESHHLCEILEFLYRDNRLEDTVAVCCKKVLLVALWGVLLRKTLYHEGDELVFSVLSAEALSKSSS